MLTSTTAVPSMILTHNVMIYIVTPCVLLALSFQNEHYLMSTKHQGDGDGSRHVTVGAVGASTCHSHHAKVPLCSWCLLPLVFLAAFLSFAVSSLIPLLSFLSYNWANLIYTIIVIAFCCYLQHPFFICNVSPGNRSRIFLNLGQQVFAEYFNCMCTQLFSA